MQIRLEISNFKIFLQKTQMNKKFHKGNLNFPNESVQPSSMGVQNSYP